MRVRVRERERERESESENICTYVPHMYVHMYVQTIIYVSTVVYTHTYRVLCYGNNEAFCSISFAYSACRLK